MYLYTLFGSNRHRETNSQLEQGAVVTVFGSTELDLTRAQLASDQVVLNIINALGETSVIVPTDWAIESTLMTMFGESRGIGQYSRSTDRCLKIQGLCLLGEVRIERAETFQEVDPVTKSPEQSQPDS